VTIVQAKEIILVKSCFSRVRPQPVTLAALALALPLMLAGCGSGGTQLARDGSTSNCSKTAPSYAIGGGTIATARAVVATQSSIADLVARVSPAVVNITTLHKRITHHGAPQRRFFDFFAPHEGMPKRHRPPRHGAGSGFIVDAAGYIVTNQHVVQDADEVKVRLRDNRRFTARVVGRDAKLDLALLKIESDGTIQFPAVPLGDSQALRVGEHVLAVGNPFGLGHTVTMGIVSAKARSIGAGPYDDFIQTDASINPGNSGGPLFDLNGRVVGINTAIRAGADGIGFAIPVRALKDVMTQLRNRGFVERGKLGLMFQPVTEEIASALGLDRPNGAMVSEVMPRSAADRAGLRAGDVILAVGDVEIVRATQLPRNVARFAPGSTIDIHILRHGKRLSVRATLDKLADDAAPPRGAAKRPKPDSSGKMLGLELADDPHGGVRVVNVSRPHQGIERGDIIVEINGKAVTQVAQLKSAVTAMKAKDTVLLKIRRGQRQRYVGIPLNR
jgi:serine protease Do